MSHVQGKVGTESYVNPEEQRAIDLFIQTLDDRDYLENAAENLRSISECKHKAAPFDCFARISCRTKLASLSTMRRVNRSESPLMSRSPMERSRPARST